MVDVLDDADEKKIDKRPLEYDECFTLCVC